MSDALLRGILSGAELEVRSAIAPTFTVQLDNWVGANAPNNPVVVALKPTIILRRNGAPLLEVAPAGAAGPNDWVLTVVVVALAVAVVAALVSSR